MESFVLLAYASLAASRTLLQQLLAYLHFTLESEDLSFWYKWKKWFLWTMAAAQAAENHGDKWGLTLRDIYINSNLNPLTKFTSSSSRSTEFKPMEHLSNNHKDRPNQNENIHKLCNETSMETDKTTWSEFPNGGKAILKQILVSEEINKSKIAGL